MDKEAFERKLKDTRLMIKIMREYGVSKFRLIQAIIDSVTLSAGDQSENTYTESQLKELFDLVEEDNGTNEQKKS